MLDVELLLRWSLYINIAAWIFALALLVLKLTVKKVHLHTRSFRRPEPV